MGIGYPFRLWAYKSILMSFALVLGCSTKDPLSPEPDRRGEESQNDSGQAHRGKPKTAAEKYSPMAGLVGALDPNGEPAPGDVVSSNGVPFDLTWQALAKALPNGVSGWSLDGVPQGEITSVRGVPVPLASCRLKAAEQTAEIKILDTIMNPLVAMPYNMAHAVRIDSPKERVDQTQILGHPAAIKYNKRRQKAEILIMVRGRIMVTITVFGAANETPAVELAKSLNLTHLSELVGGQG